MRSKDDRKSGMARPTLEESTAGPRPDWLKVRLRTNQRFFRLERLVREQGLNTVCQSAACPNRGECWTRGAVTFMILGDVCTRSCGFCDVKTGRPPALDWEEPKRLAVSLAQLELRYAVVTSVDRDDLEDGGAGFWAETIHLLKVHCPELTLEALTPDFKGNLENVATVVSAGPDVFAHNVETVARLHRLVRPQAGYERSLSVLEKSASLGTTTKSGLMVGLGETNDEVYEALREIRSTGCQLISIGQYMRAGRRHLPVRRWVHPEEFVEFRDYAEDLGYTGISSAPLVRSSYRAEELI